MSAALRKCALAALWLSAASACLLTFAWPFAVSMDPEQPGLKVAAIATLVVLLGAMLALLAANLGERR